MKNIIKKSWRDVTINEYFDFRDKLESASSDYEKEIIKIAFVNGFNEDDVWNMTISDVKRYQQNTFWLNDFEISKDVKFTSIKIEDEVYKINSDMQNFSVAQYIDFQNFFPKRTQKTNYIGNILACFIVPKGKKYGEGYDIAQLVNKINDNVDILTSNEIIFFFLKRYLFSIKVMLIFFKYQMKILKLIGKKKHKEKIKAIEEKTKELEQNISVGLLSLITSPN
jgi:hypothetical protein